MIKIGREPRISEVYDRWGQSTGEFTVYDVCGYVDKEFWTKVERFQKASKEYFLKKYSGILPAMTGYWILEELKVEIIRYKAPQYMSSIYSELKEEIKSIIKPVNCLLWEMNLLKKLKSEDYIRTYAVFGEEYLFKWSWKHAFKTWLLRRKVKKMNRRNKTNV